MNDWVILDPSQFVTQPVSKDLNVDVGFSPYDFPTAVRIDWDAPNQTACLQFRYLTEEKTEPSEINEYITAQLGQKSKRLYGLRIDAKGVGPLRLNASDDVLEAVKNAFQGLQQIPCRLGSPPNRYRLAEDAVEQNLRQLFSSGFQVYRSA